MPARSKPLGPITIFPHFTSKRCGSSAGTSVKRSSPLCPTSSAALQGRASRHALFLSGRARAERLIVSGWTRPFSPVSSAPSDKRNRDGKMIKVSKLLLGAGLLALAACGGQGDDSAGENVQENYEAAADNLEAMADNTTNEM